ncbi:MAG: endonuclease NucS [Acidimicrobiia bacterium]
MRLVIARCSVDYEGRLNAHLSDAVRLLMVKADGCVAIHADGGAYKPLNWMNAPNQLVELEDRWEVTNAKGERLIVTLHQVISDTNHALGVDPGLTKDGVEAHLQEMVAEKPWVLEEGLTLVRREFPTDLGPIDLVCVDRFGAMVAIEVKRRGEIAGVEQLGRYLERLRLDGRMGSVRGVLVAQSIAPQARLLARARGLEAIEVDYDGLREAGSREMRLF